MRELTSPDFPDQARARVPLQRTKRAGRRVRSKCASPFPAVPGGAGGTKRQSATRRAFLARVQKVPATFGPAEEAVNAAPNQYPQTRPPGGPGDGPGEGAKGSAARKTYTYEISGVSPLAVNSRVTAPRPPLCYVTELLPLGAPVGAIRRPTCARELCLRPCSASTSCCCDLAKTTDMPVDHRCAATG